MESTHCWILTDSFGRGVPVNSFLESIAVRPESAVFLRHEWLCAMLTTTLVL